MLLYTLVIAEIQADRWSEYFDIKNATVASLHNIEQTIPAILLDPLWNLLGFNKVKLTPKVFKDRLGVFGEPTSLGIILGIIMLASVIIKQTNKIKVIKIDNPRFLR